MPSVRLNGEHISQRNRTRGRHGPRDVRSSVVVRLSRGVRDNSGVARPDRNNAGETMGHAVHSEQHIYHCDRWACCVRQEHGCCDGGRSTGCRRF